MSAMQSIAVDHGSILASIGQDVQQYRGQGEVASTIQELGTVDPEKFGIHLITVDGGEFGHGDNDERFSIQSISKVLTLAFAFTFRGERIWERIGVEPSGNAFNSLVQLEYEHGRPRNPFINAGALVIADILISELRDPKNELLAFVRMVGNGSSVQYDKAVARSEAETGYRNAALANLLKSYGNLENPVEDVLDLYFHQCALAMSCRELAHSFLFLANNGYTLDRKLRILGSSEVKRLNALMQTCGFYDESGEFTYKVGLPGKSGIGGGIVAIHPAQYAVATWGPRLNNKGNSVLGMKTLELLTTRSGMSIF
jgi:glutaminase